MAFHMIIRGMPKDPRYNPARDLAHSYTHFLQDAERNSYVIRDELQAMGLPPISDDDLYKAWAVVAEYYVKLEAEVRASTPTLTQAQIVKILASTDWMTIDLNCRYVLCAALGKTMFATIPVMVADLQGITSAYWPRTVEEIINETKAVQKRWSAHWFRYECGKRYRAVLRFFEKWRTRLGW